MSNHHEEELSEQAEPSTSKVIEGTALIAAIREKVRREKLDLKDVVRSFGFTPIYFTSLSNGHRPTTALQRESLEAIARFLNLPYAEVAVLAGKLRVEDFFLGSTLEDELNAVLKKMQEDPGWMIFAPNHDEWVSSPLKVRIATALLYEKVKMIDILTKANLPKEIVYD